MLVKSSPARVTQALILAAGRGERLRPLTDRLPKPLVRLAGLPLIDRHLNQLRRAGIRDCVINTAYLGHLIERHVGEGTKYGVRVRYSREPEGALETGGGIQQARRLMRPGCFLAINADVWSDFDLTWLPAVVPPEQANLVLVPNPPHRPRGDFSLLGTRVANGPIGSYTFAGIAVYSPALFDTPPPVARFPLGPILRRAADLGFVRGAVHRGRWFDIGTPARLATAGESLTNLDFK